MKGQDPQDHAPWDGTMRAPRSEGQNHRTSGGGEKTTPLAGLGAACKKRKVSEVSDKGETFGLIVRSLHQRELVVGEKRGSSARSTTGRQRPPGARAKSAHRIQGKAKPVTKWGNGIVGIAADVPSPALMETGGHRCATR